MKTKLLLVVAAVLLLLVAGWANQTPRTWEYKFEYNVSEKRANALGSEGWELATASAAGSGPASNVETFVFKRPKG